MFCKRLDYRYYFVIVISYALLLIFAIGCIFMRSDRLHKQLEFYSDNPYQYTYEFGASVGKNDYLNCISVSFYTDSTTSKSILCDRLMAMEDSEYDEITPFATERSLGDQEIAISYNLAQKYGLAEGSLVYSRHNVKNELVQYTVIEILPVCYGISRIDFDTNYGVIIMGYDKDYHENTNYTYTVFYDEMPTSSIGLINFTAKETHIASIRGTLTIWQSIIALLVIGLTAFFVVLHWKNQKKYYSRLCLCGSEPAAVKKQIILDLLLPGALGLVIAFAVSLILSSTNNDYFSYKTALISTCVGFAALVCSSAVTLQKWSRI